MWRYILSGILTVGFFALLVCIAFFKRHKKAFFAAAILLLVFGLAFSFYPLENTVFSFATPESLARYACKGDVVTILEGESSCFILYTVDEDTTHSMVAPRTADGYKLNFSPSVVGSSSLLSSFTGYLVTVYSVNGIDYYVTVNGMREGHDTSIGDNRGSHFVTKVETKYLEGREYTDIFAYAYLKDYDEGYEVTITGENGTEVLEIGPETSIFDMM